MPGTRGRPQENPKDKGRVRLCATCSGSGKVDGKKCIACGGKGRFAIGNI